MSIRRTEVVCIGAATLDAVVVAPRPLPVDGRIQVEAGAIAGGGPAATAAVALVRQGVATALIGRVGDDVAGSFARATLAARGVDVSALRATPGARSAFSAIVIDRDHGSRLILTLPASGAELDLPVRDVGRCRRARWIHVDQAGWPLARQLRDKGLSTPISVDGGNAIPDLDLSLVTLYAPTESQLMAISGTANVEAGLRWALERGPRLVVATRGAAGSIAMARFDLAAANAQRIIESANLPAGPLVVHREPAHAAPVVSTLGAGDVFHGALLAGLVRGLSVADAMRLANVTAALSCASLDGQSGIPTREQLDAYLIRKASNA